MKKKRKGTFFSTKGKISTGDWGKICGEGLEMLHFRQPLSEFRLSTGLFADCILNQIGISTILQKVL